jgi:hypothetical protein
VRNEKAERRKRKLAERARRQRSHRAELARRAEFPEVVISDAHADPAFAAAVREAAGRFDYRSLPKPDQELYRRMRRDGIVPTAFALGRSMAEARVTQPGNPLGRLADFVWHMRTGECILRSIPEADRLRFFPLNDFRVLFQDRRVVVQCVSLVQVKTSRGRAYHSRFRPLVEFDGRKYVVCFSPSVIGKLHRRLKDGRMTYAALGDIYAFFEPCRHFEPCRIRGDGERRDELVEAVSFFDNCRSERFWNHHYVSEVLGEGYDPKGGTPYHRVGYCPVVLDGEHAVATSFLPPGFKKTPEYEAIMRANLPWAEKERPRALATDEMALVRLTEDCDFSAVRLFHEGRVPQVVQTHEKWFVPYGV